jgi:FAD/FMN-containing dehydrogenase
MSRATILEDFFKKNTSIRYLTPESPDYLALREAYSLESKTVPIGIARPQNANDVAAIVSFAVSKDIPITVRTGGHDMNGRSYASDALCIDMRDIKHVEINEARTSALVGGGALQGDVLQKLATLNLMTPTGPVPSVGYV